MKARVKDYMTKNVIAASPDETVEEIARKMIETDHDGFPVIDEQRRVVGYISSRDLLLKDPKMKIGEIMKSEPHVVHHSMDLSDVARILFRLGISKLPVVDDEGRLVGIISNSDVIRSQIERASPEKVWKLKRMLEIIHNVDIEVERDRVRISELRPTQSKIYADELQGRIYELKRGLAEPLIVVEKPGKRILVDGHHRVVAAKKIGIEEMDAFILKLDRDIPLGIEKSAELANLKSIEDIKIVDELRHPA
ncbi:MAG: hypothetical protein PWR09_300, partial [Archaeoglobi archaeon]|nr:hypothetical protein [Archaeoglobi archaeon]